MERSRSATFLFRYGPSMSGSSRAAILLCALMLSVPSAAQGTRVGIAIGVTRLDFSDGWVGDFGAALAEAWMSRPFGQKVQGELAAFIVAPSGGSSSIPGCVPGAPCVERNTPDVFWGLVPSLSTPLGGGTWRAAAGLGGIQGVGIKGPGSHSSVVASGALQWARIRRGLTPTLRVRGIGLTSSIAGIRFIILPMVGLTF